MVENVNTGGKIEYHLCVHVSLSLLPSLVSLLLWGGRCPPSPRRQSAGMSVATQRHVSNV